MNHTIDREDIRKLIDEEHCEKMELCIEKFISKKSLLLCAWAVTVVLLGMVSGAVAWAMVTDSAIGKLIIKSDMHDEKLREIQVYYKESSQKLDKILNIVSSK
jgi:hypothetical protein